MQNVLDINPESISTDIERFIKNKLQEFNRDGVMVGLSGGIDSTVVAFLAARAVGPENVTCIMLPDKHSAKEHLKHARMVVEQLGTNYQIEDLTPKLNKFGIYRLVPGSVPGFLVKKILKNYMHRIGESSFAAGLSGPQNKLVAQSNAFYRIKHRMRMVTLYYQAESKNLLVAGAANKTEFLIGLFIQFGCDSAADIMPICHLYKTQVRQLAPYLGVPQEIIDKPPSADLIPGVVDEFVMGIPYEKLDLILDGLENHLSREEIARQVRCECKTVENVEHWITKSRYKRETPYIPEFTKENEYFPTNFNT